MKKKIFLMLCVSMLTSSMFAGVRLKSKPQPKPQTPIESQGHTTVIDGIEVPL